MAKGRGFLKVCGILMIIGGAISIIVTGIVGIVGYSAGSAFASEVDYATGAAVGIAVLIAAVIGLIGGVLELIAGIVGVKNSNKPEKATACIVWGFIVLALNVISLICAIAGGNQSAGSIIASIICGLALPVLYLIGAFLNKKNA